MAFHAELPKARVKYGYSRDNYRREATWIRQDPTKRMQAASYIENRWVYLIMGFLGFFGSAMRTETRVQISLWTVITWRKIIEIFFSVCILVEASAFVRFFKRVRGFEIHSFEISLDYRNDDLDSYLSILSSLY